MTEKETVEEKIDEAEDWEDGPKPLNPDDCIVPGQAIPPEEIARYSPIRDEASEQDIANYINGQAPDETVKHVERVKTEHILGDPYEVWDVTTDKDRYWVITNMTNLYSQNHFTSLDYTLSFHVGLMMRIRSRPQGADAEEPHPFDNVFRRQEQAKDKYDKAIEAEEYQAVGMLLRECLISLIEAMRRRVTFAEDTKLPQASNFKEWSDLLMGELCPGGHNKELRQYLKAVSDRTWLLVNWLTHDRNANDTATSIAIHACDTLIGHYLQISMRAETDNVESCPLCSSRKIRSHFDIAVEPDGSYFSTCGTCGWSSHPGSLENPT